MRWDYPLLDINPVFPGLGEFIIIIIILSLYLVVNGVNFMLWEKKMKKKKKNEIPKYVQAQSSILSISNGWPACLMTTWMVKEGWLGYMWSEIFSQIRLIIFRGCTFLWVVPLNGLSHLPGQPGPYNQLLIELLLLVPECCFLQNIEVRVLKC